MKKLFVGAAIAMSSLAFAQQFGIKGGMNLSTISNTEDAFAAPGDANVNSKSKVGFNVGVFANLPIAESFSIQPELLYNALGTKLTGEDELGNEDALTWNLDYLSLPVMFQYNATPAFYLEAGPQFSYLLSSKLKYNDNATDNDTDGMNKFDVGVGIGAGYWITPNFGVNARYIAGFTDIVEDNPTDNMLKNNNLQVGLAYKF